MAKPRNRITVLRGLKKGGKEVKKEQKKKRERERDVGQGEILSSDLKNLDVYRENLLNLIQLLQILVPASFCQR